MAEAKWKLPKHLELAAQFIYSWLRAGDDLSAKQKGVRRFRKIDHTQLVLDVEKHPDSLLWVLLNKYSQSDIFVKKQQNACFYHVHSF